MARSTKYIVILLAIVLFASSAYGMGWFDRPLPKPDAPKIRILDVNC
ncbi:MAG: hypothetical protein WC444_06555 [Candidatus Paceibacterota bacterium]